MLFPTLSVLMGATMALAASLQQVNNWGSGPSGVSMHIYVPDRLACAPAIVVAVRYALFQIHIHGQLTLSPQAHPCGGNAQQMYSSTRLPSYADQHGFILIYPQTTRDSNCWDVYRPESLTHNGGSDSAAVVAMVNHAVMQYAADRSRVYMMGVSSGAMLANVMAATYPDVFEAAASFSGVPAGCFAGAPLATPFAPNQTCAQGQIIKSAPEWGNYARNMYPGYAGRRPRMQIWHGTQDFLVVYAHLAEQLKQWSDVLGVSLTRQVQNTPVNGYTQMIYGDGTRLQGYSASGVGHTVPVHEQQLLQFFRIPN